MNTDYEPKVLVDCNDINRNEWLDIRKKGVGGSDVAAIFGVSPFKTTRDLYYEKLGETTDNVSSNWIQLEYGNALEDLVGKVFSSKTDFKIEKDTNMYVHPNYDFMFANIDFVAYNDKGEKCILECKTTNFFNRDTWANGVPFHYELQCRHYMAVLNIDVCYIACLWDNNEDSFTYYRIDRDLEFEEEIIKKESFFWYEYVWSGIEPAFTENPELALKSIKKFIVDEPKDNSSVTIPNYLVTNIKSYLRKREERLAITKQAKAYENEEKSLCLPILDELKSAETGFISDGINNYFISNKLSQRIGINKENLEKLKLKYPDVYDEFVTITSSRSFSINEKPI